MLLKKFCAICSAVLVAFSCSLVPAVISPAFAADTDHYYMDLFFAPPSINPIMKSDQCPVNSRNSVLAYAWAPNSTFSSARVKVVSSSFEPADHVRYLYLTYGIRSSVSGSVHFSLGGSNSSDLIYCKDFKSTEYTSSSAVTYLGRQPQYDTNAFIFTCKVAIPANATSFSFHPIWSWDGSSSVATYGIYCESAFIVDTSEDVSALLDDILKQCISMNTELDVQTTIIKSINTHLNNINTHLNNIDDTVVSLYQLNTNKTCAVGYLSGSDGTPFSTVSVPYDVATAYCAFLNANFVGESIPYFSRDDSTPSLTRIFNSVSIDNSNRLKMSFIYSDGSVYGGYMCDSAKRIIVVDPNTNYGDLIYKKCTDIYSLLRDTLADESVAIDNKSQHVADQIMQQDNSEQYWNDKNQENFNALDLNNFSFSSGVVSALGTVGNLFTSIWNSLGDTVIIFTFPLILGITLVAIGRVSRHGGKGKDDKGGGTD